MKSKNVFFLSDVLVKPALHCEEQDVEVPEITIPPGSVAEAVIEKAVAVVGELFAKQTACISAKLEPERYQSACFDTAFGTGWDAAQALARGGQLVEAAIAQEVFARLRSRTRMYPTTASARAEAKQCATECGRFVRPLLIQQQSLAM